MRFLIKFATRNRPEWFQRSIRNILSTINTEKFFILVSADHDDATMNNLEMQQWIGMTLRDKCTICYGDPVSKIDAINRDMDQAGEWDVLVNMSDDMFFIYEGWDRLMEKRIRDTWGYSFDFFAHFNDGYAKDALATMSVIGRDYYKRDGYIYHPSYKSFSCDAEAYYVALMRGRHHYFADALFVHQHPANKPMPNDETYRRNALATQEDTTNYFNRLRQNFYEPTGHDILRNRTELKRYL